MKFSIPILASICVVAAAINTGKEEMRPTSISSARPLNSGGPIRYIFRNKNWAKRPTRELVDDDLEVRDTEGNEDYDGSINDQYEDYKDEADVKWELKWDERIEQDRHEALHDIPRFPPNVTDYSNRVTNDDPTTLEYWTSNNKRYVIDLTERLSYLLLDLGIDINAAFCGDEYFGDVILRQHPDYEMLVESIHQFGNLLYALSVNLRDEMCGAVMNKKRDDVVRSGFQLPKLRTREDVERFLKMMDNILKSVGTLPDVEDEEI